MAKRDRFRIEKSDIAGIRLLKIQQFIKENTKRRLKENMKDNEKEVCLANRNDVIRIDVSKANQRLQRKLKKYSKEEVMWFIDEELIRELEITNFLFEARKQEMLSNLQRILQYFQQKKTKREERNTFLLIIDSIAWNQNEITGILSVVKNYYEEIQVVLKKNCIDKEHLKDFFLEEYGVVLCFLEENEWGKCAKGALFLLEEWDENICQYTFEIGYMVAEWENGIGRRKKHLQKNQKVIADTEEKAAIKEKAGINAVRRELYAGFVYEKARRELPYNMAVVLIYQYLRQRREHIQFSKLEISIVAIYNIDMI